jgi:DNA-binding NarL/FixJ family response regulator
MSESAYSPLSVPGVLRILVVDDQPLVRQGLAGLLALEDDLEVVGQAENGAQALALVAEFRPDVVLMDIRMPVMNGIEATAQLKRQGGPPVVLLTTFEEVDDMIEGLNAGADGYLFKSAEVEDIQDALRRVVRGERIINARVAAALAQRMTAPQGGVRSPTYGAPPHASSAVSLGAVSPNVRTPSGLALTEREAQVISALSEGLANKRIAQLMGISEGTIKVHVSNILSKLEVENRTEAVLKARRLGLISGR